RPSEPVETVSTSIDLGFLPSRMIEPLPKLRSIWESAASRAFDLSMENPSTIRSARAICFAPYDRDSKDRQTIGPRPTQGNVHPYERMGSSIASGGCGCAWHVHQRRKSGQCMFPSAVCSLALSAQPA